MSRTAPPPVGTMPTLLTEEQVAELTGIPVVSLKTERHRGVGMPYVKLSPRRVRYRADEVAAYIEAHTVRPGSREPAAPQPT
jgi:hypothetical protein